jgi:hypothetical protein
MRDRFEGHERGKDKEIRNGQEKVGFERKTKMKHKISYSSRNQLTSLIIIGLFSDLSGLNYRESLNTTPSS